MSITAWIVVLVFTVSHFLFSLFFVLPCSLLWDSGTRRLVHVVARNWARGILATSPVWRLDVEGVEHVKSGTPYVIVANHQSMIDILVALAGLPAHFKFIAKQELFSVPFIGWHMTLAGYIPLDRANRESGRRAVGSARQWLAKRVSVLFFPEGTRSPDGEIRDFKLGAFKIAAEEGMEILPIVIDGTGDALPKKSWRVAKTTRFILSIGRPLRMMKGEAGDIEKIKDRVRGEMIERLAAVRKKTGKDEGRRGIKILTLNTWQEKGPWRERWENIFEGLNRLQPDILGFQEIFNPAWAKEIQARTGLPFLVFSPEPSGLVLLSRFPVVQWDCLTMKTQSPGEDYLRYALFAELRIEKEHLAVFNKALKILTVPVFKAFKLGGDHGGDAGGIRDEMINGHRFLDVLLHFGIEIQNPLASPYRGVS